MPEQKTYRPPPVLFRMYDRRNHTFLCFSAENQGTTVKVILTAATGEDEAEDDVEET